MTTVIGQCPCSSNLFADRPAPKLRDPIIRALRFQHQNRCTEHSHADRIRKAIVFHRYQHFRKLAEVCANCLLTQLAVTQFGVDGVTSIQNHFCAVSVSFYDAVRQQQAQDLRCGEVLVSFTGVLNT